MHINSVLADINQATLKSELYVLPVFMHSVNSWNNKYCILLFIKSSLRWFPHWRHVRVQQVEGREVLKKKQIHLETVFYPDRMKSPDLAT